MLAMGVGPPESPAQGEAPNHRKLRRDNGRGGERCGKGDRERTSGENWRRRTKVNRR